MTERTLIERLARHFAANDPESWPQHADEAASVLAMLKEPDDAMRAAGDGQVWRAMIDAALRERWQVVPSGGADPSHHGTDEEGEMPLARSAVGHDRADWVHIHPDKEGTS
ncbi:hypothetical protein J3E64_003122 [Sphingobium sp. OAS761]|uniref:hypothetical protein n=1 Tax=Sphingobium sp. OAS761 TaxID=2817901 RepID=UPI0020A1720C|nr:hypothetical protein [Sphingobium sp. OAS761]MCP1471415.1 hypothetical protein [Sphingobium sp. OAS761]